MNSTEKELFDQLKNAIASANAAAASANTAAASANAAQSSVGALAGVAGARTQSNTEQSSGTESVLKSVSQHIDSDIGIPEAWSANVKRTYDVHQSYDMETQSRNRIHFDSMITQMNTHLANLNQMSIQALANNQNQSNLCNTLSIDRAWNVNETDALAVLLNEAVGNTVKEEKKN